MSDEEMIEEMGEMPLARSFRSLYIVDAHLRTRCSLHFRVVCSAKPRVEGVLNGCVSEDRRIRRREVSSCLIYLRSYIIRINAVEGGKINFTNKCTRRGQSHQKNKKIVQRNISAYKTSSSLSLPSVRCTPKALCFTKYGVRFAARCNAATEMKKEKKAKY